MLSSGRGWWERSHPGFGLVQGEDQTSRPHRTISVSTGKLLSLCCPKVLKSSFSQADFVEMYSGGVEAN